MPYITARDGGKIHVRAIGQGQPVLMLHGLGMSSFMWLPLVLPHIRHFRFYMPDFRGHGKSINTRLNQPDVFQNHCEDVQDTIVALGLNNFAVIGLSLGATTALHLQRETGFDQVRRYLHIDQSPCVLNQSDWPHGLAGERQDSLFAHMRQAKTLLDANTDTRAEYFSQLPRQTRQKLAEHLSAILLTLGTSAQRARFIRTTLATLPTMLARRLPLLHLHDMRAYLHAYSGGGHDYRPSLTRGNAPVTVMIGKHSPLYASPGQMLIAQAAERGKTVIFENSGHVPFMDEPKRFRQELRAFLHST